MVAPRVGRVKDAAWPPYYHVWNQRWASAEGKHQVREKKCRDIFDLRLCALVCNCVFVCACVWLWAVSTPLMADSVCRRHLQSGTDCPQCIIHYVQWITECITHFVQCITHYVQRITQCITHYVQCIPHCITHYVQWITQCITHYLQCITLCITHYVSQCITHCKNHYCITQAANTSYIRVISSHHPLYTALAKLYDTTPTVGSPFPYHYLPRFCELNTGARVHMFLPHPIIPLLVVNPIF